MRVLMLEFNELCPSLVERFIAAGELPNFARLRDRSFVATTDAQEAPPNLEPWIQWVTVHTGLSFAEHGCFKLNDGGAFTARRIWDDVSAEGGTAWVCGSMNANVDRDTFDGYFLPDPWAPASDDHPQNAFKPYLDVVRAYVQEHSGQAQVSPMMLARFARFMLAKGLSYDTIVATVKQLVSERTDNTKWRRALILDRLQWDLFKAIYRRSEPQLATFFLNSTAHFQHFHWRDMEPDLFVHRPDEAGGNAHANSILTGYRNMDRIIGDAFRLADDETAIVLCTALSQQPMQLYEEDGGQQLFRHRDIGKLLNFAGVDTSPEYRPVMSQEFMLHFESGAAAAAASRAIEALQLDDGRQVMWAKPKEPGSATLNAGCQITNRAEGRVVTLSGSDRSCPFEDMFYPLEALRSGMHHPDGLFWISAPGLSPQVMADKVPLTDVYPTLARLLDLKKPSKSGRSILQDSHFGAERLVDRVQTAA